MKIYLDNENKEFHKTICIQRPYCENIIDELNLMIDLLKAYGYSESVIVDGFMSKCSEWGLIEPINGEQ